MNSFKRKGAGEPQETLSEFKSMFSLLGEPKRGFRVHPGKSVLRAYLRGDLPDEWRAPSAKGGAPWMDQAQQPTWTLQDVSLHVATCHRCSKAMAALRQGENATSRFEEYFLAFNVTGLRGRLWSYANAVALVAAFAVITQISWNSNPVVDVVDRAAPAVKNVESYPLGIQPGDRMESMLIRLEMSIGVSTFGSGGGSVNNEPNQHRGHIGLSL